MSTPDYYLLPDGTECRKFIEGMSYYLGTAFAYLWRAGHKPGEPMVKDLKKALDNIRFELERGGNPGTVGERKYYVAMEVAKRSGLSYEMTGFYYDILLMFVESLSGMNYLPQVESSLTELINSLEAQNDNPTL